VDGIYISESLNFLKFIHGIKVVEMSKERCGGSGVPSGTIFPASAAVHCFAEVLVSVHRSANRVSYDNSPPWPGLPRAQAMGGPM
jgi:hypothetical protein